MNECLLILVAPPALEESLVDWLLERHEMTGFSSMAINSHGGQHGLLSLAEQVSGRRRKIMLQITMQQSDLGGLSAQLHQDFHGTGVHYWVVPVIEGGYL